MTDTNCESGILTLDEDVNTFTESGAMHISFTTEDPTIEQRMKLTECSGVLDFWNNPEENIYSEEDCEPIE